MLEIGQLILLCKTRQVLAQIDIVHTYPYVLHCGLLCLFFIIHTPIYSNMYISFDIAFSYDDDNARTTWISEVIEDNVLLPVMNFSLKYRTRQPYCQDRILSLAH